MKMVLTSSAIGKCMYDSDYIAFPTKYGYNYYIMISNKVRSKSEHGVLRTHEPVYLPKELFYDV